MSGHRSRIPEVFSAPDVSSDRERGYMMELCIDPGDDDYGFKSLPEYALKQIFLDVRHDINKPRGGSVKLSENKRTIPTIVTTPDSPETLKKKRRAPEPPGLLRARNKFPSSDDIVQQHLRVTDESRATAHSRPKSLSPNRFQADLWDELLVKLNSQSPSPSNSPRMSRTKHILSMLRSPRTAHRRRGPTLKDEEEAGFRTPSNNSSIDETDGSTFLEDTLFFGLLSGDLERDTEFEVGVTYSLFSSCTSTKQQLPW